jgi:hypothetical protein
MGPPDLPRRAHSLPRRHRPRLPAGALQWHTGDKLSRPKCADKLANNDANIDMSNNNGTGITELPSAVEISSSDSRYGFSHCIPR